MANLIEPGNNDSIEDRIRNELIRDELNRRVSSSSNNHLNNSGQVHSWSETLVGYLTNAKDFILDQFRTTKREIVALGLAGAIITGVATYRNERIQNHILRVKFSETEHIEDKAAALGMKVPAFTDYTTKSLDNYNKYFETYNTSWEKTIAGKDNTRSFAKELGRRMDPASKKYRYELQEFRVLLPQLADSLKKDMDYLANMKKEAQTAYESLKKAWDADNDDVTHTESELVPVTHIDEDGNVSISMEWEYTTVYDYTVNKYTYFEGEGLKASTSLNTIQRYYPKIKTDEWVMAASETHPENEEAIFKSRAKDLEGKSLTSEESLALTNSWIKDSKMYAALKELEPKLAKLMVECDKWQTQKYTAAASARASSHKTYDRSHPDPVEMITCKNAIPVCRNLVNDITDMFEFVETSKNNLTELNALVDKFLIKSDSRKVTPEMKRLNRQIIKKAINGYEHMFPYGVPVEHARWWKVPVFLVLGGIVSGGIGAGVDYLGDKTNLYGRRRREDELQEGHDNFNRPSSRSPYSSI